MINEPEVEVIKSLARLAYNDDFKTVRGWLESELSNISKANDEYLDEILLRRGQGAALLLRQFMSIQDNAETTLSKIR